MLPQFLIDLDPDIFLGDNYVVIDFETTNKDKGSALNPENRILICSWKLGGMDDVRVDWRNEFQLQEVLEAIEQVDFIVAHNAKFELQWLERAGLDLHNVLAYDTMIGRYVQLGNKRGSKDLDSVAALYNIPTKNNLVKTLMKHGVCPSEIPASLLHQYAGGDVLATEQIFLRQRQELKEKDQLKTLFTRMIFTPVLADVEKNGMQLDKDRVLQVYDKVHKEYVEIEKEIDGLTGGINANSPKQVAEFLYDVLKFPEPRDYKGRVIRTEAGARKTDTATIEKLKAKTKRQKEFITKKKKLNVLNADLSKALTKFRECVTEEGGILYAVFNQTITQTHRLSSTGTKHKVQFQNLARKFKPLFKARYEGWRIGEIDGAQLEFRVAAFLGGDRRAAQDIREKFDVHSYTARILTEGGQPTDRQGAKAHTFKPLYGGSSGTGAEQQYYSAFKEKYKDIAEAQQAWIKQVLKEKELQIPSGLIFYWPDTSMDKNGYVKNTTSICNYPVQSFATADIIPIAVTYMWHRLHAIGAKSFIVNTIHDSAILEIHPDEEELFNDVGVQAFTDDVYNYLYKVYNVDFDVPLEAEAKVQDYWNDSEEWREEWLNEQAA